MSAESRLKLIEDKMHGGGVTFKFASAAWDLSDKKRLLLKDMSVPELKRRKFLPKGAAANPWA